jgi:hypothetical protein
MWLHGAGDVDRLGLAAPEIGRVSLFVGASASGCIDPGVDKAMGHEVTLDRRAKIGARVHACDALIATSIGAQRQGRDVPGDHGDVVGSGHLDTGEVAT